VIIRRQRGSLRDLLHRRPALSDRPPSSGPRPPAYVRGQLEELDELFDQGLLSRREYERRRRELPEG
jgi:hypothetical protein